MSKILYIILYILQCLLFTHAQNVQTMVPQDFCVPVTLSLRCLNNYIVVIRSAFYGIAKNSSSCVYKPGDCIADAMDSLTCFNDPTQCPVFGTRRKLSQCNDQYSSYFHVEYDCVPISMNDTSKEYNICQNNTEITTNNGIIRSPGYPLQFQTTTYECFRAIHVPNNKIIRLWLSDLYIASTNATCANDHVYVVDNIQTFRHCGHKRYAYPYLCSSTIIIQYLVTTQLSIYKGMRMYFEIADRYTNDNCLQVTATPIPSITTTVTTIQPIVSTNLPIYVLLGISSPTRNFQICPGESYTIECPNDYVIAVTTNIYGVTSSNQCEQHDAAKHCVSTTDPPFLCRQICVYLYPGNQLIPTCNNSIASYHYVEYQCIPTKTALVSINTLCPNDGSKTIIEIDRNGRFQSYNYPKLTRTNCTYRLKTKPGYIMHIYALDISLNNYIADCTSNKITFIEDSEKQGSDFCEERTHTLIYSSCSNELDLHYIITDDTPMFSYGIELYIETQTRPLDWSCGETLSTSTNPTAIRTTPTTPKATPIANISFMAPFDEIEYDICYGDALNRVCPYGYTFMIVDAYYGVKNDASNKCGYVQGDCTQEATATITQCQSDFPNCYLPYSTKRRLAQCSDKYADYLHITYQCVPSSPTGSGLTLQMYDICDTNNPIADIHGIVLSPGFPRYSQTNNECQREILRVNNRVLKIWLNEIAVASGGQRSLNDDSNKPDFIIYKNNHANDFDDIQHIYPSVRDTCVNDYLIINTPHISYVYCGKRKLSLEPICASNVRIQYKTTSASNLVYKGFKFYFQWIEKPMDITCHEITPTFDPSSSSTTPSSTPLPIWAENLDISPIFSKHICIGTEDIIQCPRSKDYVLSIMNSKYAVTGTALCETPSFSHCHQETSLNIPCTHSCLLQYIIPKPLSQCANQTADYLNVDYNCIPTRLPNNENPIDICASTITDTIAIDKGMIISPQYPSLSFAHSCSKTIQTLPSKLWMIYIVDLFLKAEDDYGNCNDASLTIYDGKDNLIICGSQQPELILISCSNIVQFNFISSNQALGYRGFKVLFETIDVPIGWLPCSLDNVTSTSTTTTITSSSSSWVGPGPVSTNIFQSTTCVQQTMHLQCNSNYGLVLHKIDLAVSRTGSCNYAPNDCFQDRTYLHSTCGGRPSCSIFPPAISLSNCNNSKSTYLYAEYQCIPTQPKLNVNICSLLNVTQKVEGGAIVSSFGYTPENEECQISLESSKLLSNRVHKAFSIYIVILNLPVRSLREQGSRCNNNDPHIEIEDSQIGITRLCGNSHTQKLFETCSNTIKIRYKNFNLNTNNIQYKGFQFYVESIEKTECSDVVTIFPPSPQKPFVVKEETLCALSIDRERISMSCTPNHGLVFLQSYEFVTNNPQACDITQYTCRYLSEQPQGLCSGQQSCTYIHSIPVGPQLSICGSNKGDSIQFHYQCIPMKPTLTYSTATFCHDTHITFAQGFIETQHYPNSYQYGSQQCSLRISLPTTPEGQQLSIFLYIIDLSIRDTSTIDSISIIECYDSIIYRDRKTSRSLCGNIDQPMLAYQTDKDELELTLNITETLSSNISSNWHGARFFFVVENQSFLFPPTIPTSTSTQEITTTTTPVTTMKTPIENTASKNPNHGPLIAGILVGIIVILGLIGFIFYRRRLRSKAIDKSTFEYRRNEDQINADLSNGRNDKRSSIPLSALKAKTYHEQIQIKDGSLGNSYEKIFNRFLDETVTQVTVQDPYIRAFHQISNFLRFCEVIIKSPAKTKRIDLITSVETNEQAKQIQIEQLNQFKEHLQNKHSIELTIQYLTGLHDREIKLNNGWIIKIGRGLDFYKPPESKLSIGYYDLDLRPCHQTTIDIFHAETMNPSS